jgi:hypothetical protein
MTQTLSARAGRELGRWERSVVNHLVDNHDWRYVPPKGRHAKLFPADPNAEMVVVGTTVSDHRARQNLLRDLRRNGAPADLPRN